MDIKKVIILIILILPAFTLYALDQNTAWSGSATQDYYTSLTDKLRTLPKAKTKIIAAVYNFTDQTGQYKSASEGNVYSKAVTQGADSMVIKALLDSNWFVVVERTGFQNLINERKIVDLALLEKEKNTDAKKTFTADNPLIYSHILIEGGIIAYETNLVTGGAGLRYLGIGGHKEFRRDQVTVFLRAVSVKTGQVLKIVHAKKSILSVMVDFSIYRFFDEKQLIEIEAGASFNEPPQVCVKEAIEKAVMGLVIEGIRDGMWELDNPADSDSPVIKEYLEEEKTALREANSQATFSPYLSLGLDFSLVSYSGDYTDLNLGMGGELFTDFTFVPFLALVIKAGILQIYVREKFKTNAVHLDLGPQLNFNFTGETGKNIIPNLFLGLGVSNYWIRDQNDTIYIRNDSLAGWKLTLSGSAGLEYYINPRMSVNSNLFLYYPLTDQIDGLMNDTYGDLIGGLSIGVSHKFIMGKGKNEP